MTTLAEEVVETVVKATDTMEKSLETMGKAASSSPEFFANAEKAKKIETCKKAIAPVQDTARQLGNALAVTSTTAATQARG